MLRASFNQLARGFVPGTPGRVDARISGIHLARRMTTRKWFVYQFCAMIIEQAMDSDFPFWSDRLYGSELDRLGRQQLDFRFQLGAWSLTGSRSSHVHEQPGRL